MHSSEFENRVRYAQHFQRETSITLSMNKHFAFPHRTELWIIPLTLFPVHLSSCQEARLFRKPLLCMYAKQIAPSYSQYCLPMLCGAPLGSLIIAEFQKLRYILGLTQFTQSLPRYNVGLLKGPDPGGLKPLS